MTRNQEIMQAIRTQNITSHIEKMMREDIRIADEKRLKEILKPFKAKEWKR